MKSLEISTLELNLFENEYLLVRYKQGAVIGINETVEMYEKAIELINFEKYPLLVDIRHLKSINKEARNFIGSPETSLHIAATAVLANSSTTQIIANIFITFQKPPYPMKVFSEEQEALNWLKQFFRKN